MAQGDGGGRERASSARSTAQSARMPSVPVVTVGRTPLSFRAAEPSGGPVALRSGSEDRVEPIGDAGDQCGPYASAVAVPGLSTRALSVVGSG